MNQISSNMDIVELSKAQKKFAAKMLNPFKFRVFTLTQVPLGFIAGMKLESLEGKVCETSLPYKFLNKNPFKSTYFAAQSMAAELSTAALGMLHLSDHLKTIAFIIVDMEAKFVKKATAKVTFTCEDGGLVQKGIEKAYSSGEAVEVKMKTEGRMPDGQLVSTFYFTWSFKKRK